MKRPTYADRRDSKIELAAQNAERQCRSIVGANTETFDCLFLRNMNLLMRGPI